MHFCPHHHMHSEAVIIGFSEFHRLPKSSDFVPKMANSITWQYQIFRGIYEFRTCTLSDAAAQVFRMEPEIGKVYTPDEFKEWQNRCADPLTMVLFLKRS